MGSTIVTAVGVAVQSSHGTQAGLRLQQAMNAAVEACVGEGLSLDTDAALVRARVAEAHAQVLRDLEDEGL